MTPGDVFFAVTLAVGLTAVLAARINALEEKLDEILRIQKDALPSKK